MLNVIMMGPVAVKAEKAIKAVGERKKPGPKKGWKKSQEQQVGEAA